MKHVILIITAFVFFSCGTKTIRIASSFDSEVGVYAADELEKYLNQIYWGVKFETVGENESADIQFVLSKRAKDFGLGEHPTAKESFKIIQKDKKLYIISPDERGLLNATYALLEKLGCGFYISNDVLPEAKKWISFKGWEMEDTPLFEDRNLFTWHNFLSGCTGWSLDDWKSYIDQANKMRYNGIMVHAYGNNPMFSYNYLGETKTTGYFNNTASGRDWGNEHVNDVRRLVGGDLFDEPVYGAEPSFAPEETKVEVSTKLMHQVFQYAEERGTRVIFALDFDTWMSNPQNVVQKLPKEALFDLNGYLTPNPEHPDGYKYYKHQLKELIAKYPQIDELTVWSRSPRKKVNANLGTIWMAFPYEKFPENWKIEYKNILKHNPDINDDLMASGLFAFSKIIKALKIAAGELKLDLDIGYGSWNFYWLPVADVFLPVDVPIRPLDATIAFDSDENEQILATTGAHRKICPIVWAHHDDFSYIGRPYAPYKNLSDLAEKRKIQGLGIIHWTTHPLDIYFSGTAKQLWKTSKNESLEKTLKSYVKAKFGTASPALVKYYNTWMANGPIFGRETSDHFIDLGKLHWKSKLKPWKELIPEAEERLILIDKVAEEHRNNYWKYQRGMEEFYISFFKNQAAFTAAYKLLEKGETDKATKLMQTTNAKETIAKYVAAIKNIGFTAGEKALVISLNTRWVTDFTNLKQRLGLEPIRFKFSPTQHDPLAQMPGKYTYFIDKDQHWWRCLWEHELSDETFVEIGEESFLQVSDEFVFDLNSMHGQKIPEAFNVKIKCKIDGTSEMVELGSKSKKYVDDNKVFVSCENGTLFLRILNDTSEMQVSEIEVIPTTSN